MEIQEQRATQETQASKDTLGLKVIQELWARVEFLETKGIRGPKDLLDRKGLKGLLETQELKALLVLKVLLVPKA